MDLNRKQFKLDFHGKNLTLETSKIAEQATSSVIAYYGGTVVLATVVMGDKEVNLPYFPLRVDYEERFYASGKILGSRFMRREGRPSEEAVLTGRLIDRSIRPLFDKRIRRDIQVVITILSYDEENDPAFPAFAAVSTALAISEVPWAGPVGAVSIARDSSGAIMVNPENSKLAEGWKLQAFLAGTLDNVNMVEFEGRENKEDEILKTFETAQKEINRLIEFQNDIVKEIGRPKAEIEFAELKSEIKDEVNKFLSGKIETAMYTAEKADRSRLIGELKSELKEHLLEAGHQEEDLTALEYYFETQVDNIVHKNILEADKRPDGRALDEVRDLHSEVGLLERTHGSAIFVRGNTQALAVTTLGPPGAEQLVDSLEFSGKRRFLLHYNFPPFSVGETGPFRGPGRREIGHGALAEKAIRNLLPEKGDFPYTIRIVSEILSSNGSSSMATVCAGSLSLMDAGVPMKNPVAGIAMGLIADQQPTTDDRQLTYKVLTDIQGPEDHYGDMDFKVAGTIEGVTAMQLDTKIGGLPVFLMTEVFEKARLARIHILENMGAVLPKPRAELSPYAPLIIKTSVDPSRIGEVIGPGGKVINGIIERTGVQSIDIDDDGMIFITGNSKDDAEAALKEVNSITREFKINEVITGKIIKLLDFGAIVDLGGGRDGMVHISEFADKFVDDIKSVAKIGDTVRAKVIKVDNGKIGLSLKNLPAIE
jgi:polyribonucleotide nucleotidyltransferase